MINVIIFVRNIRKHVFEHVVPKFQFKAMRTNNYAVCFFFFSRALLCYFLCYRWMIVMSRVRAFHILNVFNRL